MPVEWSTDETEFLLTRLLRGATSYFRFILLLVYISTHTPLARRDILCDKKELELKNFYSHAS